MAERCSSKPTGACQAALLAVDVGLRAGLATFAEDGRLLTYRSTHFPSRSTLRQAVHKLLRAHDTLAWLALEGGGPLAETWAREGRRRDLRIMRVTADGWRDSLLHPREQRTGRQAKRNADDLARRVIEWSDARRPTSLRHDAAEAILAGLWAVSELGWIADAAAVLDRSAPPRRPR